jgi:hypothetical protein
VRLIVLGALPLGAYEGKMECWGDCATEQAVFLLHREGSRGTIAILAVTVAKQMIWLRALKCAILLDQSLVNRRRQIALVEVLLGLDSQYRQIVVLDEQQHILKQVDAVLLCKLLGLPLLLNDAP